MGRRRYFRHRRQRQVVAGFVSDNVVPFFVREFAIPQFATQTTITQPSPPLPPVTTNLPGHPPRDHRYRSVNIRWPSPVFWLCSLAILVSTCCGKNIVYRVSSETDVFIVELPPPVPEFVYAVKGVTIFYVMFGSAFTYGGSLHSFRVLPHQPPSCPLGSLDISGRCPPSPPLPFLICKPSGPPEDHLWLVWISVAAYLYLLSNMIEGGKRSRLCHRHGFIV